MKTHDEHTGASQSSPPGANRITKVTARRKPPGVVMSSMGSSSLSNPCALIPFSSAALTTDCTPLKISTQSRSLARSSQRVEDRTALMVKPKTVKVAQRCSIPSCTLDAGRWHGTLRLQRSLVREMHKKRPRHVREVTKIRVTCGQCRHCSRGNWLFQPANWCWIWLPM